MSVASPRPPRVPPPWFVHAAWRAHRALHRISGGRFLWTPSNKRGWGALRLTTVGRRSGQERSVIIGYLEDGPDLVALAMNGWDEGHPAWWLNLEARPDAVVRIAGRPPRPVRARAATGEERDRLWQRWVAVDGDLDSFAVRRKTETPVVVLEPRPDDPMSPVETVYDAAGGEAGLVRLAHAWHERVLADEVVAHAFSHGFHPDHTQRLAAYWVEALGGPAAYTGRFGDESAVVRMHSGNGPHEEMDRRAIACFDQALTDVGIGEDDPVRPVLHDYFAWATTTTMSRYHQSADDVPDGLSVPRWSWDGLQQ